MNKSPFLTFVLLFSLLPNLRGQQPRQQASPSPSPERAPAAQQQSAPRDDDQEVVRITTNLVQVDAVVTKDGKQITNLKQEDFEIFEDGKPQTITQFSYISNVAATAANILNPAVASQPRDKNGPPIVPARVHPNQVRRTVLLVVDDLGIAAESMHFVKRQLRKFLDAQLQPNDLVSIIQTGGSEVGALQQFTTDKRLLSSAVEHMRWNPCSRAGTNVFGGAGPSLCSQGTLARSLQVLRFGLQGMRDLPGRKSMVVLSDSLPLAEPKVQIAGFEDPGVGQLSGQLAVAPKSDDPGIGDQMTAKIFPDYVTGALQRISELAIRASVVIYAVDTRGLQVTGWQAMDRRTADPQHLRDQQTTTVLASRSASLIDGREGGRMVASETGGFAVYNSNDFGLQRVMDDQRGYYLIGYRPNDETFNRRFHQIKVRAKGSGLEVRTRKGFFGITESEATTPELTARDKMAKALMSPFGANDVNVRLTTIFANDPTSGPLLRSFLFLDARDLTFVDLPDGMHEATFDLGTVIFGDYGKVIGRRDEKVKLRLRPARYDQVLREGVVYKFVTPVKQSGAFQFRIALRDTASSRIGAAGQFIEVPNLLNGRLALSGILVGGAGTSADEVSRGPAVRQFQQGSPLTLAYTVYNAVLDKNTHLPQLTAQTRIYRDGQAIYTGKIAPLDVTGQPDLQRIVAAAQLELGSEFSPGEYVLQIIVGDQLAKEKQGTASQWIDFAIVK